MPQRGHEAAGAGRLVEAGAVERLIVSVNVIAEFDEPSRVIQPVR